MECQHLRGSSLSFPEEEEEEGEEEKENLREECWWREPCSFLWGNGL